MFLRCYVPVLISAAAHASLAFSPLSAQPVTFNDVAPTSGIAYQRSPSPTFDAFNALLADGKISFPNELIASPLKMRGAPGVALLDFDGDRDLDIFVTNGPGSANSLYANQLRETGALSFVDVAAVAGVAAPDMDASGVCFGDIDNDRDPDLFVLSVRSPNRLFENLGNGTFTDISGTSGLANQDRPSTSCAMGDVNNDGLLDIAVANAWDMSNLLPILVDPFGVTDHNQLLLNSGENQFVDVTQTSGFVTGEPAITWAVSIVDYDQDGDGDIIYADDQGAIPPTGATDPFLCAVCGGGGLSHGYIRIFENDGTGQFADVTEQAGTKQFGQWMGLAFADFNADGTLDIFASNFGDYGSQITGAPFGPGDQTSRWFLQDSGGSFSSPGVGALITSPFGWGVGAPDYDNDGDSDIIMNGGMDVQTFIDTPPTWALLNDGAATFTYDAAAFASSGQNIARTVNGQAIGDLNADGFVDVVTVSNADVPMGVPQVPYPVQFGAPHETEVFVPTTTVNTLPSGLPEFLWNGFEFANGSLAIEQNSASNRNRSITVRTLGSVGLLTDAVVNRDGIGAVVSVTPSGRRSATRPVLGGSSYASQDSLALTFGLGRRRFAEVDVLWPGGVRNRLYYAWRGERIVLPEIPCSYAGTWRNLGQYTRCVVGALHDLRRAGVISRQMSARLLVSAIRAYIEERRNGASG